MLISCFNRDSESEECFLKYIDIVWSIKVQKMLCNSWPSLQYLELGNYLEVEYCLCLFKESIKNYNCHLFLSSDFFTLKRAVICQLVVNLSVIRF